MRERACDKKSRREMESREIPEARPFIVRESYRHNFRKFEIVICLYIHICVCIYVCAHMNERDTSSRSRNVRLVRVIHVRSDRGFGNPFA